MSSYKIIFCLTAVSIKCAFKPIILKFSKSWDVYCYGGFIDLSITAIFNDFPRLNINMNNPTAAYAFDYSVRRSIAVGETDL